MSAVAYYLSRFFCRRERERLYARVWLHNDAASLDGSDVFLALDEGPLVQQVEELLRAGGYSRAWLFNENDDSLMWVGRRLTDGMVVGRWVDGSFDPSEDSYGS